MSELLQTVSKIFSSYMDENDITYYNIPEYQRGYKWDKENVTVLLDDFLKFHEKICKSKDNDQFYCLQNITLCKTGNTYNIVDGQQRLTTLLVLLSYLNKTELVQEKIEYQIRKETHDFINEKIISRSIWGETISPEMAIRKDQYYLCEVAKAIKDWFEEKGNKNGFDKEENRDYFAETILDYVKLIVNKLEGNEEKIFSNLNGGKVNLDGADLIRAILTTRAAKEKYKKSEVNELVNEYRVRMGIEIDSINLWWGDKNVSTYFEQFIPEKTINQGKNKFDHKKFPINLLYMLYFESKKQKNEEFSFRFFEYGQDSNGVADDDNWEMFDKIMNLHNLLKEWYNNDTTYHYLGYLLFRFKGKVNFRDLYEGWLNCGSKSEFENLLKNKIIDFTLEPYKEDSQTDKNQNQTREELLSDLEKDIKDIYNDWYNKGDELFNILILQDILHCLNSKSIDRLQVKYFTKNKDDKEHIRSQTPRWKEETKDRKTWVDFIEKFEGLEDKDKDDLKKHIPECVDLNDEQIKKIVQGINKFGLNSIGNIVLLDLSVNRGYGNADYLNKRAAILTNYFSGTYIRPHTLRIFMKGNSESEADQNVWQLSDIQKNADNIYNSVKDWIYPIKK